MTTTDSTTKQGPNLGLIADHLWAFGRTRTLQAAIELGVVVERPARISESG